MAVRVNADLNDRAFVRYSEAIWTPSPQSGVDRLMLERDGGEIARATSIVRYAPQSYFAEHRHDLGEEFVVLDGVFSDEQGDAVAATYVRNPPGSSHRPFSEGGCTIFVKLRQMDPHTDRDRVVCRLTPHTSLVLHQSKGEVVEVLAVRAGDVIATRRGAARVEGLILEGSLSDPLNGELRRWDWFRDPQMDSRRAMSDSWVWLKWILQEPITSNGAVDASFVQDIVS